jgi:hypothetical protein
MNRFRDNFASKLGWKVFAVESEPLTMSVSIALPAAPQTSHPTEAQVLENYRLDVEPVNQDANRVANSQQ